METEILNELENAPPRGLYLDELSKKLNRSRNTISKHVGILEAKEKVRVELVGRTKLVTLF